MIGLEQALGVVVDAMVTSGAMSWSMLAERMSLAPARVGRLADHGGRLSVGAPATMVLVDPQRRRVVSDEDSLSLGRNNPYAAMDLPQPCVATIIRGRIVFSELPALCGDIGPGSSSR